MNLDTLIDEFRWDSSTYLPLHVLLWLIREFHYRKGYLPCDSESVIQFWYETLYDKELSKLMLEDDAEKGVDNRKDIENSTNDTSLWVSYPYLTGISTTTENFIASLWSLSSVENSMEQLFECIRSSPLRLKDLFTSSKNFSSEPHLKSTPTEQPYHPPLHKTNEWISQVLTLFDLSKCNPNNIINATIDIRPSDLPPHIHLPPPFNLYIINKGDEKSTINSSSHVITGIQSVKDVNVHPWIEKIQSQESFTELFFSYPKWIHQRFGTWGCSSYVEKELSLFSFSSLDSRSNPAFRLSTLFDSHSEKKAKEREASSKKELSTKHSTRVRARVNLDEDEYEDDWEDEPCEEKNSHGQKKGQKSIKELVDIIYSFWRQGRFLNLEKYFVNRHGYAPSSFDEVKRSLLNNSPTLLKRFGLYKIGTLAPTFTVRILRNSWELTGHVLKKKKKKAERAANKKESAKKSADVNVNGEAERIRRQSAREDSSVKKTSASKETLLQLRKKYPKDTILRKIIYSSSEFTPEEREDLRKLDEVEESAEDQERKNKGQEDKRGIQEDKEDSSFCLKERMQIEKDCRRYLSMYDKILPRERAEWEKEMGRKFNMSNFTLWCFKNLMAKYGKTLMCRVFPFETQIDERKFDEGNFDTIPRNFTNFIKNYKKNLTQKKLRINFLPSGSISSKNNIFHQNWMQRKKIKNFLNSSDFSKGELLRLQHLGFLYPKNRFWIERELEKEAQQVREMRERERRRVEGEEEERREEEGREGVRREERRDGERLKKGGSLWRSANAWKYRQNLFSSFIEAENCIFHPSLASRDRSHKNADMKIQQNFVQKLSSSTEFLLAKLDGIVRKAQTFFNKGKYGACDTLLCENFNLPLLYQQLSSLPSLSHLSSSPSLSSPLFSVPLATWIDSFHKKHSPSGKEVIAAEKSAMEEENEEEAAFWGQSSQVEKKVLNSLDCSQSVRVRTCYFQLYELHQKILQRKIKYAGEIGEMERRKKSLPKKIASDQSKMCPHRLDPQVYSPDLFISSPTSANSHAYAGERGVVTHLSRLSSPSRYAWERKSSPSSYLPVSPHHGGKISGREGREECQRAHHISQIEFVRTQHQHRRWHEGYQRRLARDALMDPVASTPFVISQKREERGEEREERERRERKQKREKREKAKEKRDRSATRALLHSHVSNKETPGEGRDRREGDMGEIGEEMMFQGEKISLEISFENLKKIQGVNEKIHKAQTHFEHYQQKKLFLSIFNLSKDLLFELCSAVSQANVKFEEKSRADGRPTNKATVRTEKKDINYSTMQADFLKHINFLSKMSENLIEETENRNIKRMANGSHINLSPQELEHQKKIVDIIQAAEAARLTLLSWQQRAYPHVKQTLPASGRQ